MGRNMWVWGVALPFTVVVGPLWAFIVLGAVMRDGWTSPWLWCSALWIGATIASVMLPDPVAQIRRALKRRAAARRREAATRYWAATRANRYATRVAPCAPSP